MSKILIFNDNQVEGFRALTLRSALGLELKGMQRRGRSVYSIVKSEFNLKGSKQKVYDQFTELLTDQGILEQ